MEAIWTEKYRPRSLSEVAGQEEVTLRLKAYAAKGSMPHLLFAGRPGTGKTTSALALAQDLYGEAWKQNLHELNASDERGIEVVRGKIKDYARTAPMTFRMAEKEGISKEQTAGSGNPGFKIIFLDEADALTQPAQAALRRTMEKYSNTCRFILSCNYSSKIIEPIQSRCAVFRFRPLTKEAVSRYIRYIADRESLKVTPEALEALVYVADGDMRRAVNGLQVAAAAEDSITAETVFKTTATARPMEVEQLLLTALKGDFKAARKLLDDLLIDYGLSGEEIIKQMHRVIVNLTVADTIKVQLVDRLGEAEFRLVEGASERIQIEALLAHYVLAGQRMPREEE